jgi:DNA-binding transcriptional MerR regulator
MYRIGEFSRRSQIPVKTLRYYDGIGLLRPAHVEPGSSYRHYSAAQIEQVNRILALKDLGFSLREVRMLLAENVPLAQMRGMLQEKLSQLEQRVDRERARLARATARLLDLERAGPGRTHEIAVRAALPRLVASLRDTLTSHEECARLFEQLARQTGRPARGQERGAIWHACASGAIDCEAFVVLPSGGRRVEGVRVQELPAQRVASLVYRGDHEYPAAYAAMRRWLLTSGAQITGPKREIYLESGGSDTESVTEIQFPILERTA